MQIFAKKGQGALFVASQSGHRQKQMGLNVLGIASSEMRKLYCSVGETGSAGRAEVQPFVLINKILRFASLELKLGFSTLRQQKRF